MFDRHFSVQKKKKKKKWEIEKKKINPTEVLKGFLNKFY